MLELRNQGGHPIARAVVRASPGAAHPRTTVSVRLLAQALDLIEHDRHPRREVSPMARQEDATAGETVLWALGQAGRQLSCVSLARPDGHELRAVVDGHPAFCSRRFERREQMRAWSEAARARTLAKGWHDPA